MSLRRSAAAACAALALAGGVAGCRSTSDLEQQYTSTGIVVGSGTSTDSRIVAAIYARALRGTGAQVSTDLGVGDRIDYVRALESGRISVVPDDTASLLAFFQRTQAEATPTAGAQPGGDTAATSPDAGAVSELEKALSKALPAYLRVSDAALASRGQAVVVDAATARSLGLHTLSDLAPHCAGMDASLVAGLVSDAQVRGALADAYHCTFARVEAASTPADSARAVSSGAVDAGGVTTLSPAASEAAFTVLDDDLDALPSGDIVPLYRTGSLGDDQVRALDRVAGELTTDDLAHMVRQVDVDGRSVDDVVGEWQAQHGV